MRSGERFSVVDRNLEGTAGVESLLPAPEPPKPHREKTPHWVGGLGAAAFRALGPFDE